MTFRWISLFGLRRQQPKARRPKNTVKPQLEELTKRIVPSATTSPQMTEAAMQMVVTMMEQQVQFIVTVDQNLVNFFDTYTHKIAQDVASVVQEWEDIAGIAPPNTGNGSGSGTITPVHNPSNQQPIPIRSAFGGGSGSGATTSQENPTQSSSTSMLGSGSGGSGSSGSTPSVSIAPGPNPVSEESGSCMSDYATREVALSIASRHTVTVQYSSSDGTASAGTDYTAESGTVTFQPGQTSQFIQIPILDDGNDEDSGSQYFTVTLSNPLGATLGASVTRIVITEGPEQEATDTLRWVPCMGNNG